MILDDLIPSVSFQRESNSSVNIIEMGTLILSLLYEKLCDAIILADYVTQKAIFYYCQFGEVLIQRRSEITSEKHVNLESNTVSRILNIEVKAQLSAGISDVLLQKRIK
ncbi:13222_t:CDS:1 [Funneliformis mosseae]|uniref:13222_t:CDS:1 n=1 Tax=Funneliformis mosseae TaxID=27381 RepID=A0A9N9EDT0_FUNMO|nr:13222_t:CDS:1 [Funneliformis mosseae]